MTQLRNLAHNGHWFVLGWGAFLAAGMLLMVYFGVWRLSRREYWWAMLEFIAAIMDGLALAAWWVACKRVGWFKEGGAS